MLRHYVQMNNLGPKTRLATLVVLGVALTLGGAAPGLAQDTAVEQEAEGQEQTEQRAIEEIIVTAQKREQALMDVGIAITALTGAEMNELGLKKTHDLVQYVPGLMMQQTRSAWIIRGVGSQQNGMTTEAATAVYVDDAYISWAQASDQQLYDMAQTEVLKGPQGTLFGRNATGGLIHFRTANPTREAGGLIDLSYGSFNEVRAEAAYGGPLSSKLSGRVAALVHQHDGYYTAHDPDLPDQEDADRWGARAKLLWDASDEWSVLLTGYVSEQDTRSNAVRTHLVSRFGEDGRGYEVDDPTVTDYFGWRNPEGYDGWNTWIQTDTAQIINTYGGVLKADWTGDKLSFTSITSYMHGESGYREDADMGPVFVFVLNDNMSLPSNNVSSITQEFNLSGGERFRWIVGAFYLNIDSDTYGNDHWGPDFGDSYDWVQGSSQRNSLSGYGQIEYDLSDKLRLVAGLRYTDETWETDSSGWNEASDGTITPRPPLQRKRSMDSPWSGKLSLEWYPADNSMAYVSFNRGTKSGGFNSINLPPNLWEFDDEHLDAFEVGYKVELGAATSLNTAAFYYDYKGYQLRTLDQETILVGTLNKDARNFGGEVELFTKPTNNLDLAFGLSLLDATLFDISRQANGQVYYWPETTMMQAPPYTFNTALTWRIPLGASGAALELHGNVNFVGEQESTQENDHSVRQDSYVYGYSSIKYKPRNQKWEAYVWVRNAFNEEYRKGGDDGSQYGFSTMPLNPPRWFGLTFRVNFGL